MTWLTARFAGAATPHWAAPGEDELRAHFNDRFLALVPPETIISTLTRVAEKFRAELVVVRVTPLRLRAQIGGLRIEAAAEAEPPHRLTSLRVYPGGESVTDPRVTEPPGHASGEVPAAAAAAAAESFGGLGLAGLILAGGTSEAGGGARPAWTIARGWADLDRGEALRGDHVFPAYGITKPVTAVAVLRLVADGRIGVDDAANRAGAGLHRPSRRRPVDLGG